MPQNQCTVEYDEIKVRYDAESDMWWVHFSKENFLGGDQSVYMDGSGITQMIIYGE